MNIKIAPSHLFNDQVKHVTRTEGKSKGRAILQNFISTEKMFARSTELINIKNLSMIVKVKNSKYSIKYTYDKTKKEIHAQKIIET